MLWLLLTVHVEVVASPGGLGVLYHNVPTLRCQSEQANGASSRNWDVTHCMQCSVRVNMLRGVLGSATTKKQ